jgi:hypothetical protein
MSRNVPGIKDNRYNALSTVPNRTPVENIHQKTAELPSYRKTTAR